MNTVKFLTAEEESIEDEKLRPTGQQTDLPSPSGHFKNYVYCQRTHKGYTREEVIERLSSSKKNTIQEIVHEGRGHGEEWAKLHAEYGELRRMAQVAAWGSDNHGGAYEVFAEVTGRRADIADEMCDFYLIQEREVFETTTHEFVMGFIEGAESVYSDVVNELTPLEPQE